MAQVTQGARQHIDLLLDYESDVWRQMPKTAAEIDGWELIDQILFVEEWPLEEQRLTMLDDQLAKQALSEKQLHRFEELRRMVEQYRPLVDEILSK